MKHYLQFLKQFLKHIYYYLKIKYFELHNCQIGLLLIQKYSRLNFLFNNVYLCWAIVGVLIITNIITLIKYLNAKKRKALKEELYEIENTNSSSDEESNSELGSIIDKMQKDMEVKPEQVVANFEQEQEENAIISYQELVNCVKNNKIQVIEDDAGDIDYVKELEQEINEETVTVPYKNSNSSKTHLDVIDELDKKKIYKFRGYFTSIWTYE